MIFGTFKKVLKWNILIFGENFVAHFPHVQHVQVT